MNHVQFDYTGAAVLVTGGTSGIGHAIATAYAAAGADVTVTGTAPDPGTYATELGRFSYQPLVTTDVESVDALVASIERLDILVNNAGANFPGGRDEWEPDTFLTALELNLAGPMRLAVGCRPPLAASPLDGGASVVNILSMAAFRSVPMVPGYSSAKAGLAAFTRNLARHWVADGIRVNAVAPGLIDTPMTAPMTSIPQLMEPEMNHIPMDRMGTATEVADAVLFLTSSAASYITGHSLAVDGGYLVI